MSATRPGSAITTATGAIGWVRQGHAVWTGVAVVMVMALFARIMTYAVRHDEQMYLPVGAMLNRGDLYTDYGFNNMPNLPLLLALIYGTSGTDHYLLAGRLLIFAGWLVALTAAAYMVKRATGSVPAAVVGALLLATNPVLIGQAGMLVTNNFLPLSFALAAMALMLAGVSQSGVRAWPMAGAGLCVALAAGFKANYAYLIPLFALTAMLAPSLSGLRGRLTRSLLPFTVGGIVGSLPTLYYLLRDPAAFMAHVIHYHRGPHIAYWLANASVDGEKIMTFAGKLRLAASIWLGGGMIVLLAMAGLFGWIVLRDRQRKGARPEAWPVALLLAIIVGGIMMSFVPTPAFPQYYVLPLPFIVLLVAFLYGRMPLDRQRRMGPWALAAALLVAAIGAPRLLFRLPEMVDPAKWTGLEVHTAGLELARLTANAKGPVATLAPLYPLEGGLPLYPEFVTGPLVYRVGDIIPAEDRPYYAHMTSPPTVRAMLERKPPAAIVVGQEGALDAPLSAFARDNRYQLATPELVQDRYGKAAVYVRR